jgi:hypothetical protein
MTQVCATILGAVVGGGIGIIAAIIGNRMSRSTALNAIRISEFNKGASFFRSAFVRELRELRSISRPEELRNDFVINLVEKSIVKHEIAFIKFEPYLSIEKIPAYHRAWRKYSNPSGIKGEENPNLLLEYYCEGKPIKECIHLALSNIENLMIFAKPK